MERKGRKHLPKVGTKPDTERVFRQSQRDLVNFGRHRRLSKRAGAILWVGVAILAILVLVSFIVLT
jgi:hypothetical protein